MEYEIAPATAQDAPEIAALCAQLGYPTSGEAMLGRLGALDAASHGVFVARHGGNTLGWVHVAASRALEYEPCAELLGLVVDPSARSGGVGAALVLAAERWARSRGFSEMRVRSRDSRERAHAFYRRAGYEEWKRQVAFRKQI